MYKVSLHLFQFRDQSFNQWVLDFIYLEDKLILQRTAQLAIIVIEKAVLNVKPGTVLMCCFCVINHYNCNLVCQAELLNK